MADALLPGVRCDVDGRRHPLACLGCCELNYGQHSTLPLHRFRLSVPETALAGHRPPRAPLGRCRGGGQPRVFHHQ
jgi:hypothetical protein